MISTFSKILGLTILLASLLSIDFVTLTPSRSLLETPIQLIFVAFVDTLLLSYFVISSRQSGWREWGAIFLVFYGVDYALTAMEAIYLPSLLTRELLLGILVNGAIVSAIYAALLVQLLGGGLMKGETSGARLMLPVRQLAWKAIASGMAYLFLYMAFGLVVYLPLARSLDPMGLALEQGSIAPSSAALILPVEIIRGALWALFAVPAIISLPFGWGKNALIMGLLFAIPMSGNTLMSNAIAPGLQAAHVAEVFGENMVFGMAVVRILRLRFKSPTPSVSEIGMG